MFIYFFNPATKIHSFLQDRREIQKELPTRMLARQVRIIFTDFTEIALLKSIKNGNPDESVILYNYQTNYRFTLLPSYSPIQKALKEEVKSKLAAAGVRTDAKISVVKLFLSSLEYQRIQNFPQHALQLVAEVCGDNL